MKTATLDREVVRNLIQDELTKILFADNEEFQKKIEDADKISAKARMVSRIIDNNGYVDPLDAYYAPQKKFAIKDLLTTPDAPLVWPKVISEKVIRAVEPNLVLAAMLRRIDDPDADVITFPIFSSMGGRFEVGETGEYQRLSITSAGVVRATVGKHGLIVDISEDIIRKSKYDLLRYHLEEAGKALARWKEIQVAEMLRDNAVVVFDNDDAGKDNTTGLDASGAANGGLSLDDVMKLCVTLIDQGFNPDTIIVHPLAYQIFMLNGELRSIFWAHNAGVLYNWPSAKEIQNPDLASEEPFQPHGYNLTSIEFPGFFGKPMKIVLSPFVPYDATSNPPKTDIYVVDSSNFGFLVQAEGVTTEEFRDPERDIQSIKLKERYAIVPAFGGKAIVAAKNVNVVKTYSFDAFYSKAV